MNEPHTIIDFWRQAGPQRWFAADPEFDQAIRELLLLQSSDWAFILTTGTVKEYDTPAKLLKDPSSAFHKLVAETTRQLSQYDAAP